MDCHEKCNARYNLAMKNRIGKSRSVDRVLKQRIELAAESIDTSDVAALTDWLRAKYPEYKRHKANIFKNGVNVVLAHIEEHKQYSNKVRSICFL